MKMAKLRTGALAAALFAAVSAAAAAKSPASVPAKAPAAKAAAKAPAKTPGNPYASYGAAMKDVKGDPSAVVWQRTASAALTAAVSKEALAAAIATPAAMDALLAKTREAYATDPVVATQIAAVSQRVMCPKDPKAPEARKRWNAALLRAAESAPDAYRKMFFLDQLRWCGEASDAPKALAVAKASRIAAVEDFAALVARELAGCCK